MVIAAAVSAVVGFSIRLKRHRAFLESKAPTEFEPPVYRSLFEPDDEETGVLEREERARAQAEKLRAEEKVLREKAEKVCEFEKTWSEKPDKTKTIQWLFYASESESAKIFSQTAESVINSWRENKIKNLTAADLAALLDSHFRVLPQQERTSGALFWLKQEITDLRRKSEEL